MKVTEHGIKLRVKWYGNPEGTELWDLDYATRKQLLDRQKATAIHREVEVETPGVPAPITDQVSEPVVAVEEAPAPTERPQSTADRVAGLRERKIFGR